MEEVDKFRDPLAKAENFSGSVLIAKNGKILLGKGYGIAGHDHGLPNQRNTKYKIATINKIS